MPRLRVIFALFLLVLLAFGALIVRCVYIQILKYPKYADLCLHQQLKPSSGPAPRGVILDSRGRVLAASNQVPFIFAEPRNITDPKTTASELAKILDQGAHVFCKQIMESPHRGFLKLWPNATPEECRAIRQAIEDKLLPSNGIGIQYDWQRYYPVENLTSHVVGFISSDNQGLGGLEYQYNLELQGEASHIKFLKDFKGRPIRLLAQTQEEVSLGSSGQGMITCLDATIQQFAREELSERMATFEAEAGIAIVAEPRTGAILAMVSLPDFDPKQAGKAPPDHLRNRAISDMYEPGSILKPIVAAIALDAGIITKTQKFYCEDGNYRGKGFGQIGEYGDHTFGDLNVKEILIKSSNIGMAKIGQKMGAKTLCDGLRLFGFGAKTGLSLPGEASGLMIPADQLKLHSLVRVPFGHAISVTGIQMVRAFCVLANGGKLVRPHLVKSFVDKDGKPVIRDSAYEVAGQVGVIIDPDLAHWMVNDALAAVVENPTGTGRQAKLERWRVFGKTGTAQVPKKDSRGYEEGAYIASFIAGAPAEDPALVVLVSIRKPNRRLGKGYTGGVVSSPVVGKILERSLEYLVARGKIPAPPPIDEDAI
jgi:cell division protein FtsI/penicillin-binding protein 2